MLEHVEISVLLPVHAGVAPNHLRDCLGSVYAQNYSAEEVVVVEDGPLSPEHDAVLADFSGLRPVMRRLKLNTNRGAGVANQAGLLNARCDWIAKLDADDLCLPGRFERQVLLAIVDDLDVCGGAMLEFDRDPEHPVARRVPPTTHREIARAMSMNNPMNHSTTFYRRKRAVEVGGYSDLRYMQDYDLFARMLAHGAKFGNTAEALVAFRAGEAMYRRRTSRAMTACEWQLQLNLRSYGVIATPRMWFNLAVRLAFRRLPRAPLRIAYRLLFES